MGFLNSMRKGFDEESKNIQEAKERSNYKTIKELEQEPYNKLNSQSDSALLNKSRSASISDVDKKIIKQILKQRGYVYDEDKGIYNR